VTDEKDLAQKGITTSVEVWEDGLRADTGRGFFEWWYFDAHLDSGETLVVVFMTKPLLERKGSLKPNLRMTLTRPDGVVLSETPIFPAEAFSASKQGCDVRIGPSWVRGDLLSYQLHVEVDEMSADLTLTGIVPPWRPRDGKVYFGDREHYFAWLPAIPFGSVEGTLNYDGETRKVKGTGYHDHNWGNVSLAEVMDHWYWGRAQLDDFTMIYAEQTTHRKYGSLKLPVFLLAKGDQILTGDGAPLRLEKNNFHRHTGGRQYPTELDFKWESDQKRVHLALRRPEIIAAGSLFDKFPPWKQKVLRLLGNPYYFRFNAEMDLDIDFGDILYHKQGAALYELMLLR
jgi:hypothetical protein